MKTLIVGNEKLSAIDESIKGFKNKFLFLSSFDVVICKRSGGIHRLIVDERGDTPDKLRDLRNHCRNSVLKGKEIPQEEWNQAVEYAERILKLKVVNSIEEYLSIGVKDVSITIGQVVEKKEGDGGRFVDHEYECGSSGSISGIWGDSAIEMFQLSSALAARGVKVEVTFLSIQQIDWDDWSIIPSTVKMN